MSTTSVVLLVAVCVTLGLAFAGTIVALVLWILRQASRAGGWHQLITAYPAAGFEHDQTLPRQTVKCGPVVYKRCVTVAIEPHGLYLRIGRRSVVVPWNEFRRLSMATLYWQKLYVLRVGEPQSATIGVQEELFRRIQPRVPHLFV